jgi:deoxycytidylate deaminase
MKLPLATIQNPELVVGLVGRIGIDLKKVVDHLRLQFALLSYSTEQIHLTDYIHAIDGLPPTVEHPLEKRYNSYIDACNFIRKETTRDDFMAFIALSAIRLKRRELTGDFGKPKERTVYIVDQLKRPEEINLLRQVYGPLFVSISCHSEKEHRLQHLSSRIFADHPENPRFEVWRLEALKLIDRDESEEEELHGQRVRDAFPLADLVVRTTTDEDIKHGLAFGALFGDHAISPTKEEYGAHLATVAGLRSIDPSRQVGCSIMTPAGELIALGCNEVPKKGGGTYWSGDAYDARDINIGHDANTLRKRNMVLEIVALLRDAEYFSKEKIEKVEDLAREFLDKDDAPLRNCLVMDSLEFGRPCMPRCVPSPTPRGLDDQSKMLLFLRRRSLAITARSTLLGRV